MRPRFERQQEGAGVKLAICAGGTGGHVFPSLAVAREWTQRGGEVLFFLVGRHTERPLQDLPGVKSFVISSGQVSGQSVFRRLKGIWYALRGVVQAWRILREEKVGVVLGMGGYASFPVVMAAFLLRVPRAILEANAVPGLANSFLFRISHVAFLNFEGASRFVKGARVLITGLPLRTEFEKGGFPPPSNEISPSILVVGGSLGSAVLNRHVPEALKMLHYRGLEFSVVHQTGENKRGEVEKAYSTAGFSYRVIEFIEDMAEALKNADVVISRSGAGFLAELAAAGRPAVLVPYFYASRQHQLHNAREFEKAEAAVVVEEGEYLTERIADALMRFIVDREYRRYAAERARSLAKRGAAQKIVDCLRELGENRVRSH